MKYAQMLKNIAKKADDTELGIKQVRKVLNLFKNEILAIIKAKDNFKWKGFLAVSYSERKSCVLKNAQTGKPLCVPSMTVAGITLAYKHRIMKKKK